MQINIEKTYTLTINDKEYSHLKWSLVNEIERIKKLNDDNQLDNVIDELTTLKDMFVRYMDK